MDADESKKLDRVLALSEENNRIIKSVLRNLRWSRMFTVLYWLVLIAISVGAFYYFQPYLDKLLTTYGSIENSVKNVNTLLSK